MTLDATQLIVRLANAAEVERLADDLDRRGGGFTKHAAQIARQRAEREREEVRWALEASQ